MKLILFLFATAVFTGSGIAQTEELPAESKEILEKLHEWELERQLELKQEIEEKRKSVVSVLEQHLEAATKRGDLDAALAVKRQIAALTAGVSEAKDSEPTAKGDEDWLVGTRWNVVREGLGSYVMEIADGRLKASTDSRFFEYKIDRSGKLTYKGLFREITLSFDKDRKTGTYSDDKGTKGSIKLIDK